MSKHEQQAPAFVHQINKQKENMNNQKYPNSLDYSNLTEPERRIVTIIRVYREKHGMSSFRNKEIIERFINADPDSRYFFVLDALDRIKSNVKISAKIKGWYVDNLEKENSSMLNQ